MLATLNDLLPEAARSGHAVPCFNVFGTEDAVAIVRVAQALGRGVILACNKDMADSLGVAAFAGMTRALGATASVPVCVHLDHCDDEARIHAALRAGFTSVMYDGSQLPLADNIARTARVADVAHAFGASLEGEIGSVPYHEGRDHIRSELTEPEAAAAFAAASGIDAMAIAVGNVHRLTHASATIDFERLARIEALTTLPLVIHGSSGLREPDLRRLKRTRVAKFNIGTTMRQTFARSLRASLAAEPEQFDRLTLMRPVGAALEAEARRIFELLADESTTDTQMDAAPCRTGGLRWS